MEDGFEELYLLKQSSHQFETGISLPTKLNGQSIIYSFATKTSCPNKIALFEQQIVHFYKIGMRFASKLLPLILGLEDICAANTA
jgi:hypothetical protein